ncbi:hypothetical protein LOK78_16520, partial [Mangrovimonas sp. AS18]
STCFAGGGGSTTGGGCALVSCGGSACTGRMRGRFSLSAGIEDPKKPNGGRSTESSSSSGLAHAFPFRILSSFGVKDKQYALPTKKIAVEPGISSP